MRIILALAFAVGGMVGVGTHDEEPVRCTEDMSCWDCETMGNRQCGPQPAYEGLAVWS